MTKVPAPVKVKQEDEGVLHHLTFYIDDRVELIKQVFASLKPKTIKNLSPNFLKVNIFVGFYKILNLYEYTFRNKPLKKLKKNVLMNCWESHQKDCDRLYKTLNVQVILIPQILMSIMLKLIFHWKKYLQMKAQNIN